MAADPEYEVHAIRYGHNADRLIYENFLPPLPAWADRHDALMPMDFFVWVLRDGDRVIAVDTGFDQAQGAERSRELVLPVEQGLQALGIARDQVSDVILTHMHWDHAGNHGLYPNARYHVQAREMEFCTGPCMCHAAIRKPYSVEDVAALLRRVYAGRVQFHDGHGEICPGVSVHLAGGHSRGLQVVRVATRRGVVVLASDAAHYYANVDGDHPFPILDRAEDMLEGFRLIRALASTLDHIVPGHDPLVCRRYPASLPRGSDGIVRLDIPPSEPRS